MLTNLIAYLTAALLVFAPIMAVTTELNNQPIPYAGPSSNPEISPDLLPVVSYTTLAEPGNDVGFVVAVIRNDAGVPVSLLSNSVTLTDKDGKTHEESYNTVCPNVLMPGSYGYMLCDVYGAGIKLEDAEATFKLEPWANHIQDKEAKLYATADEYQDSGRYEYMKEYVLPIRIANDTSNAVTRVSAYAAMFDAEDKLMFVANANTYNVMLAPGEDVTLLAEIPDWIAAQWELAGIKPTRMDVIGSGEITSNLK